MNVERKGRTIPEGRECHRITEEYRRREREIAGDRYAPWQPAEIFMREGRRRVAAALLHQTGVFPGPDFHCLEIGYGSLGWLADLISWGVPERKLHGIELDPLRAEKARSSLPCADLRVGDATDLPWEDGSFHLVVISTVLSSVLDHRMRRRIADEVTRVLMPRGSLLWYDFAYNNPRNPNVRKVDRRELFHLFPSLGGPICSVTLAPPLSRIIVPWSWPTAVFLESFPFLRTHLLAVLLKH